MGLCGKECNFCYMSNDKIFDLLKAFADDNYDYGSGSNNGISFKYRTLYSKSFKHGIVWQKTTRDLQSSAYTP